MATEETRLLKKSFDYLSNGRLTVDPKSRECIVVVPAVYPSNTICDDIDEWVHNFTGVIWQAYSYAYSIRFELLTLRHGLNQTLFDFLFTTFLYIKERKITRLQSVDTSNKTMNITKKRLKTAKIFSVEAQHARIKSKSSYFSVYFDQQTCRLSNERGLEFCLPLWLKTLSNKINIVGNNLF